MSSFTENLQALLSSSTGIFAILLLFNGSIFIHELGHFLAARIRGLQVDRFSIFGLGPKLFGWRGKSGVEYCICLLPFGAYVALPQLAELEGIESTSKSSVKRPPISYTDKLVVILAGPAFNVLFALLLATLVWAKGYPTSQTLQTTTVGYVQKTIPLATNPDSKGPAYIAKMRAGDKILSIDGIRVSNFRDIIEAIALGGGRDEKKRPKVNIIVLRNGEKRSLEIQPLLIPIHPHAQDRIRRIGIEPAEKIRVGKVLPGSPAEQAGLQIGDIVHKVNTQRIYSRKQLREVFNAELGQVFKLEVKREGGPKILNLKPTAKPITKTLAHIFLPESDKAVLEIVPIYSDRYKSNFKSFKTPSQLRVFELSGSHFSKNLPEEIYLTTINKKALRNFEDLFTAWEQSKASKTLGWEGMGKTGTFELPAASQLSFTPPENIPLIGIQHSPELTLMHPSPLWQLKHHIVKTFRVLGSLINPKTDLGISQLSGPIGIGRTIYQLSTAEVYGWHLVLWFAVLLNINLAILNLLPIPVLDGGHVVFASISKLMGRPLPASLIAKIQGVFVCLLLGIMVYVLLNDSLRWAADKQLESESYRKRTHSIDPEY